ncbi:MAG: DUF2520 domain-containing protein [Prevotella sp.]|nr:DUF2520 domain-containing protein [Prevotella sp.]
MRIVLVGAGRLATNLGKALRRAGHEVVAVWSRTMESAEALSRVVGGFPTNSIDALPADADAFMLSVKDAALPALIPQVTKGREGCLFLHTAGSMPLSLFEGHVRRYGVFYPMQTFSKEREVDFSDIPIFIEGGDPLIRELAGSISRSVYDLSTDARKHLHLAAVFACNFVNHCYALSAEVLERHGLPFDVMLPLIDETARKVHELHPLDAQTGPAVRYDQNVIGMQAQLLADTPLLQEVYRLLSRSIHEKSSNYDKLRLTEDTCHRV